MPGHVSNVVRSADGTTIGYRQYGGGDGLILVHGGMQAAQHLSALAAALADQFLVLVPDRRGRGTSRPRGTEFGLQREVEDLHALIAATGARFLFGHSSGALIVLRTALVTPAVERVALYEPPLSVRGSTPTAWLPRFDREIAAGKNAAAAVTALKGARLDPLLARLPRWLLTPIAAAGMTDRKAAAGDVPAADLVPTMRFDVQVAREMADTAAEYAAVQARVLLMGGTRSPDYMGTALRELAAVIPRRQVVTLSGLGHGGPQNQGRPEAVARALRAFFTAD
ncbi:MAG TPA: alpha/beta hydrolase [Streptosporangiaceae bacterium]|nr:alpha/beta hydrolase [Streptosporangiaceae bacterium]